jgi:hypothetical protein
MPKADTPAWLKGLPEIPQSAHLLLRLGSLVSSSHDQRHLPVPLFERRRRRFRSADLFKKAELVCHAN